MINALISTQIINIIIIVNSLLKDLLNIIMIVLRMKEILKK